MIAEETTGPRDLEAQLDEARQEIARLNADLKARTEELEQVRAAAPPEVASILKEAKRRFGRFITDKVNPGYHERHHNDLSSWSPELFRTAGEIGLITLGWDPRIGGDGRDPFTTGIMLEELSKLSVDPGFLYLTNLTMHAANMIAMAGRPEQIEQYVRPIARGECLATWAPFEPGNAGFRGDQALGFRKSMARKVDKSWVLSGSTSWVHGAAGYAGLILMPFVEEASGDNVLFMIRPTDPGVKIKPVEVEGYRHLACGAVTLEDARVEEDRRIGLELDAPVTLEVLWRLCAMYLGYMQRMLDECIEALQPRVSAGVSFLTIPQVQSEIGRLRVGIEAARSFFVFLLERARRAQEDPGLEAMAIALKYFVTERAFDTAETLAHLIGREASLGELPWTRYLSQVVYLFVAGGFQHSIPQLLGDRYVTELEFRKLRKFSL